MLVYSAGIITRLACTAEKKVPTRPIVVIGLTDNCLTDRQTSLNHLEEPAKQAESQLIYRRKAIWQQYGIDFESSLCYLNLLTQFPIDPFTNLELQKPVTRRSISNKFIDLLIFRLKNCERAGRVVFFSSENKLLASPVKPCTHEQIKYRLFGQFLDPYEINLPRFELINGTFLFTCTSTCTRLKD